MSPRLLFVAVLAGLVACDTSPSTAPPPDTGGPLIPATWYMHEADGDTLPATISVRFVGISEETTVLDSARLTINADLSYQQRYWTHVTISGVLDRTEVVLDEGTLATEGNGYRLTSQLRTREFTIFVPALGRITSSERMVFYETDPPLTAGSYRLSHP